MVWFCWCTRKTGNLRAQPGVQPMARACALERRAASCARKEAVRGNEAVGCRVHACLPALLPLTRLCTMGTPCMIPRTKGCCGGGARPCPGGAAG